MTAVEVTSAAPPPDGAIEEGGAVMERLFGALVGSLELATVHLGSRLGLYVALAEPRTAAELAVEAGIDERYAQEWLEQQAISGLVDVAEPGGARTRRYVTSPGQRQALAESESPVYAASMALLLGGVGAVLPQLPEAYRNGSGISFGEYGDDVRLGQGCSTAGPSWTSWSRSGCRACRRWRGRSRVTGRPCSISVAAWAGRASRWPGPTPR
ncbi:MAG: hypothetical protein ABIW17_04680 [Marmoricola sp.]